MSLTNTPAGLLRRSAAQKRRQAQDTVSDGRLRTEAEIHAEIWKAIVKVGKRSGETQEEQEELTALLAFRAAEEIARIRIERGDSKSILRVSDLDCDDEDNPGIRQRLLKVVEAERRAYRRSIGLTFDPEGGIGAMLEYSAAAAERRAKSQRRPTVSEHGGKPTDPCPPHLRPAVAGMRKGVRAAALTAECPAVPAEEWVRVERGGSAAAFRDRAAAGVEALAAGSTPEHFSAKLTAACESLAAADSRDVDLVRVVVNWLAQDGNESQHVTPRDEVCHCAACERTRMAGPVRDRKRLAPKLKAQALPPMPEGWRLAERGRQTRPVAEPLDLDAYAKAAAALKAAQAKRAKRYAAKAARKAAAAERGRKAAAAHGWIDGRRTVPAEGSSRLSGTATNIEIASRTAAWRRTRKARG